MLKKLGITFLATGCIIGIGAIIYKIMKENEDF